MKKSVANKLAPSFASGIFQLASLPESRRLLHFIREQNVKTLAIQSQFGGEGRTFLTALLAEGAFRFIDLRVLIIDTVSSFLEDTFFKGRPATPPAASAIDVVVAKTLGKEALFSKTLGGENQPEKNNNHPPPSDFNLCAYIRSVRDTYDLILIDCPPYDSIRAHDLHPAIIARHSDSSLMVTSPRSLKQSALVSLKALISHYKLAPLGVVFNGGGSS
jgi:Mrp family chromosome partitioning ATPase